MTIETILFFSKELPCNVLEAAVNQTGIVEVMKRYILSQFNNNHNPIKTTKARVG